MDFINLGGRGGSKDRQGWDISIKKTIFTKNVLTHNLNLIETGWWGGERLNIHESKRNWSYLIHVVLQFLQFQLQTPRPNRVKDVGCVLQPSGRHSYSAAAPVLHEPASDQSISRSVIDFQPVYLISRGDNGFPAGLIAVPAGLLIGF